MESLQEITLKKFIRKQNIGDVPFHVIRTSLIKIANREIHLSDSDIGLLLAKLVDTLPSVEFNEVQTIIEDLLSKLPQKMLYVVKNDKGLLEQLMRIPIDTTYTKEEVITIFNYLKEIYSESIYYDGSMAMLRNSPIINHEFVLVDRTMIDGMHDGLELSLFSTNIFCRERANPNDRKYQADMNKNNTITFADHVNEFPVMYDFMDAMPEADLKFIIESKSRQRINWHL